jgi:hypothetical protein
MYGIKMYLVGGGGDKERGRREERGGGLEMATFD